MPAFRPPLSAAALCAAIAAIPHAARADVQTFRDWIVACDNLRSCAAYGAGASWAGAYVRVTRGGAPDATAEIVINVDGPRGSSFDLAFDDPALPGLPEGPHPQDPTTDGLTALSVTEPAAVSRLVEAFRHANSIEVTRKAAPDGNRDDAENSSISLSGAVAALLWMDEQQGRIGTVTALIRRGQRPASSVPPVPAMAVVTAAAVNPAPPPTDVTAAPSPAGRALCGPEEPDAVPMDASRLDGETVLYWYHCEGMSGAYNAAFAFLTAEEGRPDTAVPARFVVPAAATAAGAGMGDVEGLLISPYFDPQTATLHSFNKGRGIGDCGTATDWVWDGSAFVLTRYAIMPDCRGIAEEDWPTLYVAGRR